MKRVIVVLLVITMAFSQLDSKEKNLVKAVDKHNAAAIKFLEELVNINSGTMNFEGVRAVHDALAPKFEKLGFKVTWKEGSSWGRAGHFIAEHDGKGKKFLLIGHLDTVFEKDSPFQKYEKIDENTVKGPGVDDMKGGDVVILLAMQALHDEGLLKDMNIKIVMTGDEESSGSPKSKSKGDLIEAAKWADYAIGFENGDGDPTTGIVARRSSSGWTLKVKGVRSHSSQIFTKNVGKGAIYEASRILHQFYTKLSGEENLTFNPGVILGGTAVTPQSKDKAGTAFGKSNVVAQDVIVRGDIRAISPEQLEKAHKVMREIVGKSDGLSPATITFSDGYPPLAPTKGNYKLLDHLSKASEDLGFGKMYPVNPRNAGAADVSFTAGHVEAAIDGLGLGGMYDHSVNEIAYLNTLPMQAKRAAVLLYRLSMKK